MRTYNFTGAGTRNGSIIELWAKPLPGGSAAMVAVNVGAFPQAMTLPLAGLPFVSPAHKPTKVRDVWAHADLPLTDIALQLDVHDSAFLVVDAAAGGE